MGNAQQYDEIVRNYVHKEAGEFVIVSHDTSFLKTFRATVLKYLGLPATCMEVFNEKENAQRHLKSKAMKDKNVLVLIERDLAGVSSIEFIKYLKIDAPQVRFVVLTTEIERERLILLHEMGVSNFITKPISVNVLIEKIAFTIKPPSKIGELVEAGKKCIHDKDFKKALAVSEKVLQIKPGSPAGLMLRGDALKGMGKAAEAVAAYEGAMKEANLYLEPIKKLAEFYRDAGSAEEELKYLEQLDKLSPLNVERKVNMGGLNVKLGKPDKAKQLFDSAVKITNRQAMGFISDINKSIAEMCMDTNPEMAEEFLRQSLEAKRDMLDKSDVETFNTLGIALRKQGRWEDAIKEYKKALKVAPEDENLRYNIAMAFIDGKDFVRSAKELDKALKLNQDFGARHANVRYNIGYIFAKAGKNQKAIDSLRVALSVNPDHAKAAKLLEELEAG